jgi:predicted O-methyltransferase YrrM
MELTDITGYISKENIDTIQKYVKLALEERGSVIAVDIGTMQGLSAITMATVSPKVEVFTCDPQESLETKDHTEAMGVTNQVHYYKMTSEEFSSLCPPEIDIVFVDGQHNGPGVQLDIEKIGTKVRKGGYLLFHDCNLYDNTVGVTVKSFDGVYYKFIEETGGLLKPGENLEGSVWVGQRI